MQQYIPVTTLVQRTRCSEGKLLNQYLKIRKIGEGPFSKIKLMRNIRNDRHYAMKKYNMFILKKKIRMGKKPVKYSTQAEEVLNQVEVMKRLNHPNIVKLHEILSDDEQEKIYLFMDYCEKGDIANWDHKKCTFSTQWSLKQIAIFFKQTAQGLEYLHSLNIVHRDIKPQNILIDGSKNAKLIDFGRAVILKEPNQKLSGSEGTYHFMAPEMLSQKVVGGYNGKLCDIWSLGISLFCCVYGELPFNDENLMKLFQKIELCSYKIIATSAEKLLFQPLIKQILSVDWNSRPNLAKIKEQLECLIGKL